MAREYTSYINAVYEHMVAAINNHYTYGDDKYTEEEIFKFIHDNTDAIQNCAKNMVYYYMLHRNKNQLKNLNVCSVYPFLKAFLADYCDETVTEYKEDNLNDIFLQWQQIDYTAHYCH